MDPITELNIQAFQVIDSINGIIIRRGNEQILLRNADALTHIRIIQAESLKGAVSLEALIDKFPKTDYSDVFALLKIMISRNFILSSDNAQESRSLNEQNEDIFFWQFGESQASFIKKLQTHSIFLIGANLLMRKIREVLLDYGVKEVLILDYAELQNTSSSFSNNSPYAIPFEDWESYCPDGCSPLFIAGSEFGGPYLLSEINTYCIEHDIRFMPVYLRDMIGYIGSVIVPGRTPCMKCLLDRYNGHLLSPAIQSMGDKAAFEGQQVMAWHPAMLNVLAETAGFEVMRYVGEFHPNDFGELIEIDLISRTTRNIKILKLPRCAVCSTTKKISPYEIHSY